MTSPKLFQPYTIKGLTLPNRIVIAPMCVWLSKGEDNIAHDETLIHYGSLAMGGAGLLIVEATAVEHRGRLAPEDLGLYNDAQIAPLKRINDYIHARTPTKTAIQLNHVGRKGAVDSVWCPDPKFLGPNDRFGTQPIAPSAEAFQPSFLTPTAMTDLELSEVRQAFVAAAKRAIAAGFDAIEVHIAHGYLLSSFFSPVSNRRTDQYGGTLENRMRFPLEVVKAIKAEMKDEMPLIARISAIDWVEGGTTIDDSVSFANELKKLGVDLIHVSTGGNSADQNIVSGWQYQVPYAEQIQREANIPTIAVGGIKTGVEAEDILQQDKATLVAVGRAALADPFWPRREALAMGVQPWIPTHQLPAYQSRKKTVKPGEQAEDVNEQSGNANKQTMKA